eukprot:362441-Chlamydomonas_euryale.AAC.2
MTPTRSTPASAARTLPHALAAPAPTPHTSVIAHVPRRADTPALALCVRGRVEFPSPTAVTAARFTEKSMSREWAVTGSDWAVNGSDWAVTGSDWAVTGSDWAVNGSDCAMNGSDCAVNGSDWAVNGSDWAVTGSDCAVNGSDWAVTGSDWAVHEQ